MTWDPTASAASPRESSGAAGAPTAADSVERNIDTPTIDSCGTASTAAESTTGVSSSPDSEHELYPPTETDEWLRCPVFRLYRKRWAPRDEEWQPNMLLGNAIHAALAQHYLDKDAEAIVAAARKVLEDEYVEQDAFTLEGLWTIIEKALPVACRTDLVGVGKVVAVEKRFLRCKADLIYRDPSLDGLGVWDHKVKYELDARYKERTFTDAMWQLRHNAWAAQEHFGEKVAMVGIHVVVLTARPRTFTFTDLITQEQIAQWATTARRVWKRMGGEPWMNLRECNGRFGRCPYHEGCHDLAGDESRFESHYIRKGE